MANRGREQPGQVRNIASSGISPLIGGAMGGCPQMQSVQRSLAPRVELFVHALETYRDRWGMQGLPGDHQSLHRR